MATTQRERNAAQAREKMEARREDADGPLARGRRLAQALQLDKVARLKMFPISIQAPWGISPAMLPLPTKIRTAFQPPVKLSRDPAKAKDDDYVERKYDEVQQSIQDGMDTLARRRAFPIFG